MIASSLVAAKVGLILSVLSCYDGTIITADCPLEDLAAYDQETWVGPTEADMLDCLAKAEALLRSGGRAKCEIVPADVIPSYKPAAYPAPKVTTTWIF